MCERVLCICCPGRSPQDLAGDESCDMADVEFSLQKCSVEEELQLAGMMEGVAVRWHIRSTLARLPRCAKLASNLRAVR